MNLLRSTALSTGQSTASSTGSSAASSATPISHARSAAWQAAKDILVVRLDNLGDVLMTTPAIAALADPAAGRRVTLLTSRAGAAVRGRVEGLDDVLVCDAPWVAGPRSDSRDDRRLLAFLARRRFDAAAIFTVCTQSALPAALLCRMAGIPLRLAASRENPYALLTDWVRDVEVCRDGMRHEVDRQLDLVRSVGFGTPAEASTAAPRLHFLPTRADHEGARQRLAEAGGDPTAPYVVVHPGSSAASRRWPPERFGQAAARIQAASGLPIVFAGGPDELAETGIAQSACGPRSLSVAGRLSLGELGALIADARLVVCNNSGPAHLAAATGTPVVVLYALTNPQHTPWCVASRVLSHAVPCRNCLKSVCPERHHACLLGVDVDTVAAAALDLLHETGDRAPPAAVA